MAGDTLSHPSATNAINILLWLSPRQRDLLKTVAFVAMVGDHLASAGVITGMVSLLLHAAGRVAFPLFALVCACNLSGRTLRQSSLNKLWLMAILAQPAFWFALNRAGVAWYQLNILFCFAAVMQGVRFVDGPAWRTALAALAAMLLYLPLSGASYGLRGVVLIVASVVLYRVSVILRPVAMVVLLATVLWLNLPNGPVMMLCGLTLTLAAWVGTQLCGQNSDRRLALGWYFSEAYVLHLTLIGVFVTLTLPA